MNKKDIRRGMVTIILGLTALYVVCMGVWMISCKSGSGSDAGKDGVSAEELAKLDADASFWNDSLSNAHSDVAALAGMDSIIVRFMRKNELNGLQLAVMRNDSLLYAKGYGYADAEKGVKMQPTHIMRVASVSKLITAVAMMKLVDAGKVSLDSRVFGKGGILGDPELTRRVSDERIYSITVRQLLQHSAGFTPRKGDPMFTTADMIREHNLNHVPTAEEVTGIVLGRGLGYTPGEGHKYSNFGYMVASLVIQKASGMDYWQFVRDSVLAPAGISTFYPTGNYKHEKQAREVIYYNTDDLDTIREYNNSGKIVSRRYGGCNFRGLMGAGGWAANAAGLARLVASIDLNPKEKDILSAKSVGEMTGFDPDTNRAMGWSRIYEEGKWQRTGSLSSTQAVVNLFPDGECWVMITNTGHWTGFRFNFTLDKLIDRLRAEYSSKMPKRDLFHKKL